MREGDRIYVSEADGGEGQWYEWLHRIPGPGQPEKIGARLAVETACGYIHDARDVWDFAWDSAEEFPDGMVALTNWECICQQLVGEGLVRAPR